ncbi:hypothetical protein F3Y22_tig00110956pilonHSYRG00095 [Hibiscus syriacus]|uniref:GIR1-like zinc ribbon domain-containing protein n=1 Tax=Hibiscus syriacus TaxID=106335 RepID=A0A6A2ZAI6_HIBSY|nr:hypothetical protein F3Y22_tig00110956pilonHSYRG00095 [Hibiscus syriacus]
MSRSQKVELKLKLSPPNPGSQVIVSPNASEMSPGSSCVTSEPFGNSAMRNPNSPEGRSMMVVGCPRCLMYVMVSEVDPKCPKCKSTVLLAFFNTDKAKMLRN